MGPQFGILSATLVFNFLASKTRTKQYYGLYGGQKIKGAFNLNTQEAEKGRQTDLDRFKAISSSPSSPRGSGPAKAGETLEKGGGRVWERGEKQTDRQTQMGPGARKRSC